MSDTAPRFAAILALIYDDCIARARAKRATGVQSTQTPTQEKPHERRRPA